MQKKPCLKIECGNSHLTITAKMNSILLERLNIAANALIAEQAAAARLLLASQALADCRERTNPYLPGNNPLGAPRNVMYCPDPCQEEEEALRGATQEHQAAQQAAQVSAAPDPAAATAAAAVQMSNTWEPSEFFDPVIMNADVPSLESMWSPTSLEDVMEALAVQMEVESLGGDMEEEMEIVRKNMTALLMWSPSHPTKARKKRYALTLNNAEWVGLWVPE